MSNPNIKYLDDQSFETAISQGVVLVDFYADWCGPCRAIAPIIDELANEVNNKAMIAKVDVDKAQNVSVKFGVHSIPTLIVFKDGKEVKRFVGITMKTQLMEAINQHQ
ncbi:MAG: thioredoxin [Parachlamydiales bacterium]|jgi:thioredoxin 1